MISESSSGWLPPGGRGDMEVAGAHTRLSAGRELPQDVSLLNFLVSLRLQLRHHLWETISKVPVWVVCSSVPTASCMCRHHWALIPQGVKV